MVSPCRDETTAQRNQASLLSAAEPGARSNSHLADHRSANRESARHRDPDTALTPSGMVYDTDFCLAVSDWAGTGPLVDERLAQDGRVDPHDHQGSPSLADADLVPAHLEAVDH